MRKPHFKSIGMRIWFTITMMILVITISISLVYVVIVNSYMRKSEGGATLKPISSIPAGFNKSVENKVLGRLSSFTVEKKATGDIRILNQEPWDKAGIRRINPELRMKMAAYIGQEQEGNSYEIGYNGREYSFSISPVEGAAQKLYLITYVEVEQNDNILGITILTSSIFILIGFVASTLVAENIANPMTELENYTLRIAKKDWTKPLNLNRYDELGRLAESMNQMQEALQKSEEEGQAFLQSLSHDLKTPVMVIMSHAEALIDGVYVDSAEETARIIRDEALRLEQKISRLLYLNSLNFSLENSTDAMPVSLVELLLTITRRMKALRGDIDWALETENLYTWGNREKLQVAFENVIENQIRYAKSHIHITMIKREEEAWIEIYNDGPKIEEELIQKIFETFFKGKSGKFGLGLAISRKIIKFYRGDLSAKNQDNGVSFFIRLPNYDTSHIL